MGERKTGALRVNFDRKLKLEFHGVEVTSDAGLLAYREIDDVLELTEMIAAELRDNRTGKNTQHSIAALIRQSVYSRLAGWEDVNDAERLANPNGRCRLDNDGPLARIRPNSLSTTRSRRRAN